MPHEDYCYALERENHALNEKYESLRQQLELKHEECISFYNEAETVIKQRDEARQQLSTLKAELKCIGEAIDDPRTDLTITMSEVIVDQKQQLAAALAIQPDDSALKDKAMTTYEQPKDWIERHLVEDPGGLLACEPSGLNEELKLARQANEFQHQTIKKQAAQIATMRETALNQQKREVMLRVKLSEIAWSNDSKWQSDCAKEALAATADLDGLILCHAEPSLYFFPPTKRTLHASKIKESQKEAWEPLYRAWKPKP